MISNDYTSITVNEVIQAYIDANVMRTLLTEYLCEDYEEEDE